MTLDSPTSAAAGTPAGKRRVLGLTDRQLAFGLLFLTPAMFCTNMLVARATAETVPPVALAFWRWAFTLALLAPFTAGPLWRRRAALRREWLDLVILGALGMGVCGAFVYIGADTTTATNMGLIYAASPILIVLIAHYRYGEALSPLQALGVLVCLAGVVTVIARGDPAVLRDLRFTVGDFWILGGMVAWAVYSILLRHRPSDLGMMPRFTAIVIGGLVVLAPFHLGEALAGDLPRLDAVTLGAVLLLALVPSFGAYQAYAIVQRTLGAGPTGLLMYLIPLYNGVLAWLILGESLQLYHLIGAALVLPGIYLATQKAARTETP